MGRGAKGQFLPLGDYWIAEARERIARGETARAVAARFGISEACVSKRCAGARKRYLAERNARICELSRQGVSQAAIAAREGCGQSTVSRAILADLEGSNRQAWREFQADRLRPSVKPREMEPRSGDWI